MECIKNVLGLLTFGIGLSFFLFEGFFLECLKDILRRVQLRDIIISIRPHCIEVVLLDLVHRLERDIDLRNV